MTDNPPPIDPSSLRSPQPSQHATSPLYGIDNLKCELTWSQLIHAEIIGKQQVIGWAFSDSNMKGTLFGQFERSSLYIQCRKLDN